MNFTFFFSFSCVPIFIIQHKSFLNEKKKGGRRGYNDAQTGMPQEKPEGAICVQRFDDSRNPAIHITYRISLRSSSLREPRYPLLKVV